MVNCILTRRETEVIAKKLGNKKLTQQDSNYLSRFIRPKLKEISSMDAKTLLKKLDYNQKALSIENKIKKIILSKVSDVVSIIIYGSAIQSNYTEYNDLDLLILVKKKFWKTQKNKFRAILEIKEYAEKQGLVLDIQIMQIKDFYADYSSSPDLIYQLKDSKIIYGKIKIPDKIALYNINLQMKLDWSNIQGTSPRGIEIYKALRNAILVKLLINKIIDNNQLKNSLNEEIGKNLAEKLKNNKESKIEKKIALIYLKELLENTRKSLGRVSWEKIEL